MRSYGPLLRMAMKRSLILGTRGTTRLRVSRGRLVSDMLAGFWRLGPVTISTAELTESATLLLKSGAGGLAWCRVRGSHLQSSAAAGQLHQAYRLQTLQAAVHERNLKKVVTLLRAAGVEPVLVKGWAVARLYSEPGMRSYVDLDLCVLPDQYARAKAVLESPDAAGCGVDLHNGFGKFYDCRNNELMSRSELVNLDDLDIRILGAEDHLRFLCLHLLRHGAVRPLWLCDIAVSIENRPRDFDWDRALGHSRREAGWVACAIGLAHHLLGVEIEGTPVERPVKNVPSWLIPAVLKGWGTVFRSRPVVANYLRRPIGPLGDLLCHWPNPIEATMSLRGSFNELPRLPFQITHVASRATALAAQIFRRNAETTD